MIAVLRSALALTLKEVQHHALAVGFIAAWSALMVPIAVVSALASGGTSFAAAATGLVYYYGPVVVLLVVRRLVVLEYEDGTIRFLDALPAAAWLQLAVKAAVGWIAVVAILWAMATPLLALAALRELVTPGWFLQLCGVIALYGTAWLALTLGVAHTGRVRHWIWLSMVVFFGSADLGERWPHYTWLAALAETTDATRHAFPWSDVGLSLAWTGALAVATLFLATFRGGAIPAALFRSASTRERVSGTAWILALYLLVEVWPEVGPPRLEGWDQLPQPRPGIFALGEVGPWPEAAAETLARMEALHPLDPPAALVLAPLPGGPARPGPSVRVEAWDREELVLRVGPEVDPGGRARLVDALLTQRSNGMLDHAWDRGFAVDGLGLYLAEGPADRPLASLRAALAMRRGLTREDLDHWEEVRRQFGRDLAAGVGAIGLASAAELGSARDLGGWVGRFLYPLLPEGNRASRLLGHSPKPGGVDRSALHAHWWRALTEIAGRTDTRVLPVLDASVHLAREPVSRVDLVWEFYAPRPDGAELVARPLDPLRGRPVPYEPSYRELVLPLDESFGQAPTWFDAREGVQATVRVWLPQIQGHLIAGWQELRP